ncbi:hypothetical protein FHS26_000577 [Rhizobium pisi]|jgi:hypothetical protein|uniref:Uncharacterized protein n=2 Tax=Rhizobium TaxID=379 RepID=A0A7W6B7L1_9HYPH|nr:hypothetical protein [Rhizobium pisi]MBB3913680.1 hypothetical protein [Rhizobium fabae]
MTLAKALKIALFSLLGLGVIHNLEAAPEAQVAV